MFSGKETAHFFHLQVSQVSKEAIMRTRNLSGGFERGASGDQSHSIFDSPSFHRDSKNITDNSQLSSSGTHQQLLTTVKSEHLSPVCASSPVEKEQTFFGASLDFNPGSSTPSKQPLDDFHTMDPNMEDFSTTNANINYFLGFNAELGGLSDVVANPVVEDNLEKLESVDSNLNNFLNTNVNLENLSAPDDNLDALNTSFNQSNLEVLDDMMANFGEADVANFFEGLAKTTTADAIVDHSSCIPESAIKTEIIDDGYGEGLENGFANANQNNLFSNKIDNVSRDNSSNNPSILNDAPIQASVVKEEPVSPYKIDQYSQNDCNFFDIGSSLKTVSGDGIAASTNFEKNSIFHVSSSSGEVSTTTTESHTPKKYKLIPLGKIQEPDIMKRLSTIDMCKARELLKSGKVIKILGNKLVVMSTSSANFALNNPVTVNCGASTLTSRNSVGQSQVVSLNNVTLNSCESADHAKNMTHLNNHTVSTNVCTEPVISVLNNNNVGGEANVNMLEESYKLPSDVKRGLASVETLPSSDDILTTLESLPSANIGTSIKTESSISKPLLANNSGKVNIFPRGLEAGRIEGTKPVVFDTLSKDTLRKLKLPPGMRLASSGGSIISLKSSQLLSKLKQNIIKPSAPIKVLSKNSNTLPTSNTQLPVTLKMKNSHLENNTASGSQSSVAIVNTSLQNSYVLERENSSGLINIHASTKDALPNLTPAFPKSLSSKSMGVVTSLPGVCSNNMNKGQFVISGGPKPMILTPSVISSLRQQGVKITVPPSTTANIQQSGTRPLLNSSKAALPLNGQVNRIGAGKSNIVPSINNCLPISKPNLNSTMPVTSKSIALSKLILNNSSSSTTSVIKSVIIDGQKFFNMGNIKSSNDNLKSVLINGKRYVPVQKNVPNGSSFRITPLKPVNNVNFSSILNNDCADKTSFALSSKKFGGKKTGTYPVSRFQAQYSSSLVNDDIEELGIEELNRLSKYRRIKMERQLEMRLLQKLP